MFRESVLSTFWSLIIELREEVEIEKVESSAQSFSNLEGGTGFDCEETVLSSLSPETVLVTAEFRVAITRQRVFSGLLLLFVTTLLKDGDGFCVLFGVVFGYGEVLRVLSIDAVDDPVDFSFLLFKRDRRRSRVSLVLWECKETDCKRLLCYPNNN